MIQNLIDSLRRGECNACVIMGIIAAVSAAYWLAEPHISALLMNDLVDGPLIAVSFVTGGYYLTWSLFNCRRTIDRAWMIRFGICLNWLGNGVWRVERFLYAQGVLTGPVGAHDPLRGYMILIMTVAGVMHVLAIDMEGARPKTHKIAVAAAAVVVGMAGIVVARGG